MKFMVFALEIPWCEFQINDAFFELRKTILCNINNINGNNTMQLHGLRIKIDEWCGAS